MKNKSKTAQDVHNDVMHVHVPVPVYELCPVHVACIHTVERPSKEYSLLRSQYEKPLYLGQDFLPPSYTFNVIKTFEKGKPLY